MLAVHTNVHNRRSVKVARCSQQKAVLTAHSDAELVTVVATDQSSLPAGLSENKRGGCRDEDGIRNVV